MPCDRVGLTNAVAMMGRVQPRLSSLDSFILTFAHRGASAHAPENTLEAFSLALKLGASGLESDVWATADGVAVLDHSGLVGGPLRRRPIAELNRAELPEAISSLSELYEHVGPTPWLSLDIKDPQAFSAVVRCARTAGHRAEERLWLCSPDLDLLSSWRSQTSARLVLSVPRRRLTPRPEQLAAKLRQADIDALNLHHSEWSGGLVTILHRFGRYSLGWDVQHERELAALINIGIDGLYSDHVDRMTAVANEFYPPAEDNAGSE